MQPGFMLLEVGSISRLNALNDIYKNFLDVCCGAVFFWLIGWDILTGQSPVTDLLINLGLANNAAAGVEPRISPNDDIAFLFQLSFASTAATISSGAVSGRIRPHVYLIFTGFFTAIIYPTIAFSVWNPSGLLYGVFTDFAGSVVVHSTGAAAGLAGTLLLGPRIGFNGYDPIGVGREETFEITRRHAPHNMPLAAIGIFLLWLGWFGFNGGTTFADGVALSAGQTPIEALAAAFETFGNVMVVTILGPAAAALTVTVMHALFNEDRDILDTMNGLIAGAVGITAGSDTLTASQAIVVGIAAAVVFRATRTLCEKRFIDDPVNVIAAHGLTGVLGVAAVGLTTGDDGVSAMIRQGGIGLAIFAAAFLASLALFTVIDIAAKLTRAALKPSSLRQIMAERPMRVPYRTEIYGIDAATHGQDAYNFGSRR